MGVETVLGWVVGETGVGDEIEVCSLRARQEPDVRVPTASSAVSRGECLVRSPAFLPGASLRTPVATKTNAATF
jgi:hypothetical protein